MRLLRKVDHDSGRKWVLGVGVAILLAGVSAASDSHLRAVSQKNDLGASLDQSGKQTTQAKVKQSLGKLPLAFEPNRGQTSSQAKFLARGEGYSVLLTGNAALLQLHGKDADNLVRMRFVGSNASPRIQAEAKQSFQTNYFLGADSSKWFHVPNYGAVRYDAVYPGVDVRFHGNQRKLQYDFVVAAGADPSQIRLAFDGASNANVNARGELVLNAGGNQLRNLKPYIYQERNGVRQAVEGRYALRGNEVAFEIARYDRSRALVIDPSVAFKTYVGGTLADDLRAVAVDSTGVYVAGSTTASAPDDVTLASWANASSTTPVVLAGSTLGLKNALVAKLTITGDGYSYISIFGGTGDEQVNAVALKAGEVYAVGTTSSPNFPQSGSLQAFQKAIPSVGATTDAFFSHLNDTGTAFVMSTYVGGGDDESGNAVAVDTAGNAYVAGTTKSANLLYASVVALPFQATINTNNTGGLNTDGFVVRITAGNIADYNTYFGGTDNEVINAAAVDSAGMLYLAGQTFSAPAKFPLGPNTAALAFIGLDNTNGGLGDAFAAKLNPAAATAAAQLVYSTYLGGAGADSATAIAVDLAGQAYVTGTTRVDLDIADGNAFTNSAASAVPVDPGTIITRLGSTGAGQDVFVAKLNAAGSVLKNLTTIEGVAAPLTSTGIAVDGQEQVYLSGWVNNVAAVLNVPAAAGGATANPVIVGAGDQGFFARLPASLTSLQYLTYTNSGAANSLKENGLALLDSTRDVFIAGTTTAAAVTYTPAAIVSADNTFAGASEGFVFALNFNDAVNTTPVTTATQFKWTLAQAVTGATLAQRSSKVTITNSDTGFGTLAIPTITSFVCPGVLATVAVPTASAGTDAAPTPGIRFKANGIGVDVTVILQTNPVTATEFTALNPGNYSCTLVLSTPQTEAATTTLLGNIQITAGALTSTPSSLTFNQVAGAAVAAPQTTNIIVTPPPAPATAVDIDITVAITFPVGTPTWASVATDGNTAGTPDVTVTPLAIAPTLAPGIYTAIITVSPALQVLPLSNAPVSFAATLVVSTAGLPVLSQLGIFRGPGAPGAALAQFVLDRNANEQFDLGIDTFHYFGLSGDKPVVGDWTGSGVVRMGVFRNGQWYLDLNNNGTWDGVAGGDAIYSFGLPGDTPVVGDWNGNGITKLGVFRCPASGQCTWVLDVAGHNAFDSSALFLSYGLPGDTPVVGNWIGGAVRADQIGVFRCPAVGVCSWIVDSNGNGSFDLTDAVYSFGLAGDQPVVGDWNEGGRKRIGVFRGNGVWILDSNGNNSFDLTDLFVNFGLTGDVPVVGKWPLGGTLP